MDKERQIGGKLCLPVHIDSLGHKLILGIPQGHCRAEYETHLATGEDIRGGIFTEYVAVRRDGPPNPYEEWR